MKLLVIYDISDDNLRLRASELLKDFGLLRIQYSAFADDVSKNRREMLEIRLRSDVLNHRSVVDTDRVYLLPTCDACFGQATFLGSKSRFPDRERDRFEVV